MSLDRDFDRIALAWLAEGPDELADRVLDAVVDEIHQTRQRPASRLPWRLPIMPMPARLAALVAVGVLVLAGGVAMLSGAGRGGPTPSQAPATAPAVVVPSATILSTAGLPVLDQTFVSPWHGYTVKYPSHWTVTPSTHAWLPGTRTLWGDPALDSIATGHIRFVGTSQRLGGQTTTVWLKAYCQQDPAADCTDPTKTWEPIKVNGYEGYVDANGLPAASNSVYPGGTFYDAVVPLADHVYVFTLDGDVDRAMFDEFLSTITFRAADAIDLPPLTGTFTSPTYGYSVGVADDWTTKPATNAWVGVDNGPPAVDEIAITGTDTGFSGASQALGTQTYDEFLAAFHANTVHGVPSGCDGGAPAEWPPIQIGDRTGGLEMLCNAAEALVHVGDRVYVFDWGNSTFDGSTHLTVTSWRQLLKSVRFDPTSAK